MRTKLFFVLCYMLLLGVSNNLYAQLSISMFNSDEALKAEPIDDVLFTAQYEMTFIPDTLNPDKPTNETMMLRVGKKSSVFYSYARYLTDSIIEIDKRNGASMDVISKHLNMYKSKVSYKVYKNFPQSKITYTDQIAMNRFIYEEKTELPKWKILPETTTIHSYTCQKAICDYLGRTYEAWFATDIPRSEGPWKLQGLPGLIMKAQDTEGHYKFECTGIQQNDSNNDKIIFSSDGHEPISRKKLNKIYERFAADPIGYISNTTPNVTITVKGEDGQPAKNPKNMPYNPIERD